MTKFIKLWILGCLLFFSCCSDSPTTDNIHTVRSIPNAQTLIGEAVNIQGLSSPSRIYCLDTLLLLKDNQDPNFQMFVCGQNSDSVLNKTLRRGRGPNEFLGAFYFAFSEDNSQVYVADIARNQISVGTTDGLATVGFVTLDIVPCDSLGLRTSGIVECRNNNLATLGFFDDARLVLLSAQNKSIIRKISYSPDLEQGGMDKIVMQAYDGVVKYNACHNACVIACRYADQIEIVDMATGIPFFVRGPEKLLPKYEVHMHNNWARLAHLPDERMGYVDLCVTDKQIYVLYSGRPNSDRNACYGQSIREFTWEGECVGNYDLGQQILAFDISGNQVFAINIDSEIVRYNLPAVE